MNMKRHATGVARAQQRKGRHLAMTAFDFQAPD
jgi:hypothetical protein